MSDDVTHSSGNHAKKSLTVLIMHTRASVEKRAFPGDLVMKFRSLAAEPDLAEGHEPSQWLQAGCSQPNGVSVSWITRMLIGSQLSSRLVLLFITIKVSIDACEVGQQYINGTAAASSSSDWRWFVIAVLGSILSVLASRKQHAGFTQSRSSRLRNSTMPGTATDA